MLVTNLQSDPIVEILRLAYRRGLALRQEQDREQSAAVNSDQIENSFIGNVSSPDEELPVYEASSLINKRKSIVHGA